MIKLEVEEYCENCRYFAPEKECIAMMTNDEAVSAVETIIFCKDRKRCANMYKVLKRRFEKDDRDERCE